MTPKSGLMAVMDSITSICRKFLNVDRPSGCRNLDFKMIGLRNVDDILWAVRHYVHAAAPSQAVVQDAVDARGASGFSKSLGGIATVRRVDTAMRRLLASDVEIVSRQRCGIDAVSATHRGNSARDGWRFR